MNFARLNHILIPTAKADRDRFRYSRTGRILTHLFAWALTLTEEGIGAWLLWLLAGTLALNVGTTQFYILWSALTGLLVASVVWARRFALSKLSVEIEAPRRIAVGETATFRMAVRNDADTDAARIRIHLPFLPWDGTWRLRPSGFSEIPSQKTVTCEASAVFAARGLHHLDLFSASALLPLGLAHGPIVSGACPKFRVVPRIAKVGPFRLPDAHKWQPGGTALASVVGESREIIGIRPYRNGDPPRDLHAASWARTGEPHVREYRQEYFTRIGVVVDTDTTHCSETVFEAALSLTAGLLSRLSRGEALIDLLVFGDTLHPFTLGRHMGFLDQALDLLAEVRQGGAWSAELLERSLEPHLNRLSSVVFVSLSRTGRHTAFEAFVRSRGVGLRTLLVHDQKDRAPGTGALDVTNVTCGEINGKTEIFL